MYLSHPPGLVPHETNKTLPLLGQVQGGDIIQSNIRWFRNQSYVGLRQGVPLHSNEPYVL